MPFKSKSQHRLFRAMEARGELPAGTSSAWAEETPSIKKLPERISDEKDETEADTTAKKIKAKKAFVEHFIKTCAAHGINSLEDVAYFAETLKALVEHTNIKEAGDGGAASTLGSAAGTVAGGAAEGLKTTAMLGSLLLPFVGGAGVGLLWGHGRNAADTDDIDSLRQEAMARAYARKAKELKLRQQALALQSDHPDKFHVIG